MRASSVMLFAVAVAWVGNWAHGKSPSVKAVVEAVFAVLVVAFLDQGKTEPVAKGLAWLFLAAILLSDNSPLQALAKVTGTGTGAPNITTTATPGTPTRVNIYPEPPQLPRQPVTYRMV